MRILAIVLCVLVAGVASAAVEYEFTLIEAFDPGYDLREVLIRDINNDNVACGTSTDAGYYSGFVWSATPGKEIVPVLWPRGVSDLGHLAGDDRVHDLTSGLSTVVPPVDGWPLTRLLDVNDHGVAVGYAECACSNSQRVLQSALVWVPGEGSRATTVSGAKELVRINAADVAAGNRNAGVWEGFTYDVATGVAVLMSDHLAPSPYGRPRSEAADINDRGVVVGRAWDGTLVRGCVWTPPDGFLFLPGLDGGPLDRVHPLGINDAGVVVGRAYTAAEEWDAFVWTASAGMQNLDDLVAAPADFTLDWATGINDNGWIVGIGHYGPLWGTSRGFVLEPLPGELTGVDPRAGHDLLGLAIAPNPATGPLTVSFALGRAAAARVAVYDLAGRRVAELAAGAFGSGPHEVSWLPGRGVPSGVYYVRLEAAGAAVTRRAVIVR